MSLAVQGAPLVIVTAGGAGMFCGSCMHDNTWVRALRAHGVDARLIPMYTPIRVDETDESVRQVFLGGINLYLDARWSWWRKLPRWAKRWLDHPAVIRFLTRFGVSNSAAELGELTEAVLSGNDGPSRAALAELTEHLVALRPQAILFSNLMLAAGIERLRREYAGRLYCILQGDDIFVEQLTEPYKTRALERLREIAGFCDGFLVHSAYYRDFMSGYFQVPREKFLQVPLGIDLQGHDGVPGVVPGRPFTVGYFARICPEKGLHLLIEAVRLLKARVPETVLRVGGYLGKRDEAWFRGLQRETAARGPAFEYVGSPDRAGKAEFFRSIDVFSLPTVYREPKGLSVLEALANGVPAVLPRHGAFPEMIEATGGGLLAEPLQPASVAQALEELYRDPARRVALGRAGQIAVRTHYGPEAMARATLAGLQLSTST